MKVTAVFCCSPSAQCRQAALPNASDGCLAKSHFTRRINAIACVYETNPGKPFPFPLSHYRLSTLQWVWRKSLAVAGFPRLSPISSPSITIVSVNLSPNGQSLLIWLWWLSVNGEHVFFWLFFLCHGPASQRVACHAITWWHFRGRLRGASVWPAAELFNTLYI